MRKLASLCLLLWAVVDLSVPGVCKSDADDVDATPAVVSSSAKSARVAVTTDKGVTENKRAVLVAARYGSGQQGQPAGQSDCFCCCSHVVHSSTVAPIAFTKMNTDWPPVLLEHPREFRSKSFHPPRS